jgi:hypothetical protein
MEDHSIRSEAAVVAPFQNRLSHAMRMPATSRTTSPTAREITGTTVTATAPSDQAGPGPTPGRDTERHSDDQRDQQQRDRLPGNDALQLPSGQPGAWRTASSPRRSGARRHPRHQ